jgi:hypothetical protein
MKELLLLAMIICTLLMSCQKAQEMQMRNIYTETTNQQLKQWEIVSRSGSDAEKYVHANIIAGCYLQAGNEAGYKEWKDRAESYNPMK